MDDDSRPLLISEVNNEVDPQVMNIQFASADVRSKRPFYVEPTNIISVANDTPRVSNHASAMNKRIHYYNRLTSPSDRALIAPDHVLPAPEDLYVYSPLGSAFKMDHYADGYGKNTSLVTIFMIWNTMMGTSILSIPWAIKQAGFTTGISIIILMGLLTLYCCYRVVKSRTMIPSLDTTNWEFPDVCKYYFGSFGHWSGLLFSMVSLIGAMIVYWVLMSNFLFNTGRFIFNFVHHVNITEDVLSTNGTNPGTISVIYLIFFVTLKTFQLGFHLEFHWFTSTEYFVPEIRLHFPQLTGVLTLAFFIHNCVITLLKNNKNQKNNVRDLSIAYLLVMLTYLYVGILVFASFPSPPLSKECIEQNFLDNFPSSDILSFIGRMFLLFQMMTVYPLLGYLARVQLLGYVFGNVYPSIFHVVVLNLIIVGAGVTMACFYPNIGGIIRYSGATCGLAFVFIYPSLIYIISLYNEERLTWPRLLFHSFIIILGLANLVAQFFM
uniref:Neutral amino acid transporter 9 n=1 Tax=Sarcophilus harrisii TaxID=9305 RepID=G3W292_SARHA